MAVPRVARALPIALAVSITAAISILGKRVAVHPSITRSASTCRLQSPKQLGTRYRQAMLWGTHKRTGPIVERNRARRNDWRRSRISGSLLAGEKKKCWRMILDNE